MECVTNISKIKETFSSIRTFSYQEKNTPLMDEAKINKLLDAILDFKSNLKDRTAKVYEINTGLEKMTWFNDLDEECLMLINDLIASTKDLRSTLIRLYVSLGFLRTKGIAKEEIKDFKNAIDELKENYEDLESVYFFLPAMPHFVETTKKLSLI